MKWIKQLFCKHKRSKIHLGIWVHYAECVDCGKRKELDA